MSQKNLHLEDSFWKFLVSLEELQEKKERLLFCTSVGIEEEQFEEYAEYIKRFNLDVKFCQQYVYPLTNSKTLEVKFKVSEWLSIQSALLVNQSKEFINYSHQIALNKIKYEMGKEPEVDLYKVEAPKNSEFTQIMPQLVSKKIEYSIISRKMVDLILQNGNECILFPHRLVFLDGELCVIGESLTDKTLLYFALHDIKEVSIQDKLYEPNLSQIEINEFIGHLRLINGKEERLVLKIYSQDQRDLLPENHYLGNPFVTASPEGDMIWAATIEICDDIFQWLYQMRDRVEVLDPGHIRKEFAHYCELKKENKKAS